MMCVIIEEIDGPTEPHASEASKMQAKVAYSSVPMPGFVSVSKLQFLTLGWFLALNVLQGGMDKGTMTNIPLLREG